MTPCLVASSNELEKSPAFTTGWMQIAPVCVVGKEETNQAIWFTGPPGAFGSSSGEGVHLASRLLLSNRLQKISFIA